MESHCILESLAGADTLSRNPMSVVAVADCTAPSSCGVHPRQAISKMQVLLYATEDEGRLCNKNNEEFDTRNSHFNVLSHDGPETSSG